MEDIYFIRALQAVTGIGLAGGIAIITATIKVNRSIALRVILQKEQRKIQDILDEFLGPESGLDWEPTMEYSQRYADINNALNILDETNNHFWVSRRKLKPVYDVVRQYGLM